MSTHPSPSPYEILARKRSGASLSEGEIRAVVAGAVDGSWADAQLGAFLMAAVIRGLDDGETRVLTRAMLESGERWQLAAGIPTLGDKHSTGGVGDKVSLVLGPLLAACGRPVVMLTGRGLGHTAGTADKLEAIPGLDLALDRRRCLRLLAETGLAIGIATTAIAPADRRIYALRDVTATVDSLPLITASILSKKLASGAAGVVFDVKTGSGAFLPEEAEARRLAGMLVDTAAALGTPARALITDMSQPLGRRAGHAAEVAEALECLAGDGPEDLMAVTLALCREVGELVGQPLTEGELEGALASGAARRAFERWAAAQGAEAAWLARPELPLAPEEVVLEAPESGALAAVDTRRLGLLLAEAGGGRRHPGDTIDHGVTLISETRLGEAVERGQPLARLHLRRRDDGLARRALACYRLAPEGRAPDLLRGRVEAAAAED